MLASVAASAQNVQVESISATYTSSPVIKFRVQWTGERTYRHNTKVWVFVDYHKVEDNMPSGNWARALVAATPTVSSTSASSVTLEPGNDKGFWLHGANGDYSATLTVPVTLDAGVTQFNWCAYVSDYPPNVIAHSSNSYTLRGSPPFVINNNTLPVSQTTYSGTITSMTDATGAPGLFPAAAGEKTNGMGCIAGLVENIADSVCRDPSFVHCNSSTLNLGTVSFTSGSEITIVGENISQIWSRPVTATGCQKTTFNGGTTYSANTDCRNNPGFSGDFFNGCAVLKYANQICPYPWRVPTANDYDKLINALGGKLWENNQTFVQTKMRDVWGGSPAGECYETGLIVGVDNMLYKHSTGSASVLGYFGCRGYDKGSKETYMCVRNYGETHKGMNVRCVREN
jgi:uncharacterized protein (TIGR02145 family)